MDEFRAPQASRHLSPPPAGSGVPRPDPPAAAAIPPLLPFNAAAASLLFVRTNEEHDAQRPLDLLALTGLVPRMGHSHSRPSSALRQAGPALSRDRPDLAQDLYWDTEEETSKIEKELDPSVGHLRDSSALALLRLDERTAEATIFLNRLREAAKEIDKEVTPEEESPSDLDALINRLRDMPRRVQLWKKSAARAGADIALSLVHMHCKGVDEEKLKSLRVVNRKSAKIEDFIETFLPAATRIVEVIDLDNFTDAASPTVAE